MITTQDILQRIEDELATTITLQNPKVFTNPSSMFLRKAESACAPPFSCWPTASTAKTSTAPCLQPSVWRPTTTTRCYTTTSWTTLICDAAARRYTANGTKTRRYSLATQCSSWPSAMSWNAAARNPTEALQLFAQTAQEICEGQQYDVNFETRNNVTVGEYLEMIRLKTAVFLACAARDGRTHRQCRRCRLRSALRLCRTHRSRLSDSRRLPRRLRRPEGIRQENRWRHPLRKKDIPAHQRVQQGRRCHAQTPASASRQPRDACRRKDSGRNRNLQPARHPGSHARRHQPFLRRSQRSPETCSLSRRKVCTTGCLHAVALGT